MVLTLCVPHDWLCVHHRWKNIPPWVANCLPPPTCGQVSSHGWRDVEPRRTRCPQFIAKCCPLNGQVSSWGWLSIRLCRAENPPQVVQYSPVDGPMPVLGWLWTWSSSLVALVPPPLALPRVCYQKVWRSSGPDLGSHNPCHFSMGLWGAEPIGYMYRNWVPLGGNPQGPRWLSGWHPLLLLPGWDPGRSRARTRYLWSMGKLCTTTSSARTRQANTAFPRGPSLTHSGR